MWGKSGPGVKPAVIFHGTAHAREWISTMVTEYMAYQLLTRYGQDEGITTALDDYDFYILPIVNPDGTPPDSSCHTSL
jgi:murein tripeptide amidase MpaA